VLAARLPTEGVYSLIAMIDFTHYGIMWMEEGKGWIKEEGRMARERGISPKRDA